MAWIPALANIATTAYSAWRSHKDQKKAMKSGGGGGGSQRYEEYMPEQKNMLKNMSKNSYVHLPNITKDKNFQTSQDFYRRLASQDPEMMKQFEAPYMRQFNEQTLPSIAEKFGGLGAQNSSAFAQSLGAAGAGLQERLAALRGELSMNAAGQLQNLAQMPGQQRQQEQALTMQQRGMILGSHPYTYAMNGQQSGGGQDFMRGLGQNIPDIWSYFKNSGGGSSPASNVGKVNSISNSWGYNNMGTY